MLKPIRLVIKDRQIFIATITLFCLGFTYASTVPYQSIIALKQLSFSTGSFSVLVCAAAVANMAFSVYLGSVSDHLPDRKPLILSISALGALGYGAFALFPSKYSFIVCLTLFSPLANALYALLFASIRTRTLDVMPDEAAPINSVVRSVYAASWIAIPGIVGFLLISRQNMSDSYGIGSVMFLFCLLVYLTFAPAATKTAPHPSRQKPRLRDALDIIFSKDIARPILAIALVSASHRLNATLLPLIVTGMPTGNTSDVGIIAGSVAAMEIPFMLGWAWLLRRQSLASVIALAGMVFATYLAGLGFATEKWHIYALIVPNAAGAAAILSIPMSYMQDLIKDKPGLGTSLSNVSALASHGISALIFSAGTGIFSYSGTALIACFTTLLGVGSLVLINRSHAHQPRP